MNKHILKITTVILLVFATSCSDYLDVNQDPNVLAELDSPKRLLPIAQVSLGNQLMGWDFGFGGAFWAQYWTQSYTASQFKDLCRFNDQQFDDAYSELTAGVLNDLKRIKSLSTEEDKGYTFVAEALSIYTWQIMTDMWGNIPYSEALLGDEGITHPKFDTGEDIYADLLTRINDLAKTDLTDVIIDEDFDFIYAGDLAEWQKFVASLKLKLMMRLSETSLYNNATTLSYIESGATFLTSSVKISGEIWEDDIEGSRHPMREFETGGANNLSTNVIGTKSFIDYLNNNDDPRLDLLFTAPDGGHKGAFFGDFESGQDSDLNGTLDEDEDYSEALFSGDTDLVIMSEWEINFFIAEVYVRANNTANAKTYFDKGVTASLVQNKANIKDSEGKDTGVTDTEIITTGYAVWVENLTIEENLKQIAMQKWVANANYQFIEAFLERNRTKYPAVNDIDIKADRNAAFLNFPVGDITISVVGREKSNGFLPASPVYSTEVLYRNTNAPSQKQTIFEKVWWDQKSGK